MRRTTTELTPDHPDLVPVAESSDDAAAASAVLAAAPAFDPAAQSVLKHVVVIPRAAVAEVLRIVAQDRYVEVSPDGLAPPAGSTPPEQVAVALARVQTIDALHISQERSRMAGLGARHGGTARAWQVLQLPRR